MWVGKCAKATFRQVKLTCTFAVQLDIDKKICELDQKNLTDILESIRVIEEKIRK